MPDIKVKVKNRKQKSLDSKRKWLFLGGGIVIVIIMANGIFNAPPPPPPEKVPVVDLTPETLDKSTMAQKTQNEIIELRDKQAKLERSLRDTTQELKDLSKRVEQQNVEANKNFKAINETLISINGKLGKTIRTAQLPKPVKVKGKIPNMPPPPPTLERVKDARKGEGDISDLPPNALSMQHPMKEVSIASQNNNSTTIFKPEEEKTQNIFIPNTDEDSKQKEINPYAGYITAGFAPAVLLTGVSANTATTTKANPQPLLLRVQADAILPGDAKYKLKSCFITASAYGSLSDERAHVRTAYLSCVDKKTKHVLEAKLKGYVLDSDGIFGIRGKLIEKRGAVLAKTMLAGFAQGLSDAGRGASTATGLTGVTSLNLQQTGQSAALSGLSASAGKLADFYLKQAESMFPVIEVAAGRKVYIVISKGTQLMWSSYDSNKTAAMIGRPNLPSEGHSQNTAPNKDGYINPAEVNHAGQLK